MIQIKTLAFVCGYYFIFYGDGARSTLCDKPEKDSETDQKLWRNVWVSKNKDPQCSCSSLSNLLHFLGDSVGGNKIYDIKNICHDQHQMRKKYGTIHFSKQRGQTAMDWMMKILGQYHGYAVQQLNKSLSKSLMKTMSEVQTIVEKYDCQ